MEPIDIINSLGGVEGGVAGGSDSQGFFNKSLGLMKDKPELTSIILDYLGQSLASREEGNIAGGLGTALAKSSLSEKALKDIENKKTTGQEDLIKTITDLIGGKMPGASSLTPAGQTGITGVKVKPDNLGGSNFSVDFDTEDSPGIGSGNQPLTSQKTDESSIYKNIAPNFLAP